MCLYLAKCDHFGEIFTIFDGLTRIWQNVESALANFYAIGKIFVVVNSQMLTNNVAIWSH